MVASPLGASRGRAWKVVTMSVLMDVLGWAGGLMIAVAYSLVSTRRIAPDSAIFQGMNMLGAVMLGTACVQQGSFPSAFINAVWVVVGVKALLAKVPALHPQPQGST